MQRDRYVKMNDGDPVCVFLGQWRCLNGEWKFRYTPGVMAKTIIITENMSFEDLKNQIFTTFGIDGSQYKIGLSFWSSEVSNACTQSRLPPVSLSSDNDLLQFRNNRLVCKSLSIFMNIAGVGSDSSSEDSDGSDLLPIFSDTHPSANQPMVELLESFEAAHRFNALKPVEGLDRLEAEGLPMIEYKHASDKSILASDMHPSGDQPMLQLLEYFEAEHRVNAWKPVGGFHGSAAEELTTYEDLGGSNAFTFDSRSESSDYEVEELTTFEDRGGSNAFALNSFSETSEDEAVIEWCERVEASERSKVVGGTDATKVHVSVGTADGRLDVFDWVDDSSSGFDELVTCIEKENHPVTDIPIRPSTVNPIDTADNVENTISSEDPLSAIRLSTQTEPPSFSLGISEGEEERVPVNSPDNVFYGDENQVNLTGLCLRDTDPIFNDSEPVIDYLPRFEVDESWYIHRIFANKEEFKSCLAIYALERCFGYIIKKSCKARIVVKCVDQGCSWRIYCRGFSDTPNIEIRTMVVDHSCGIEARSKYVKRATPKVLGELLLSKYAHGKTGPRACDIPEMFLADFNLNISYMKAWHAKEIALEKARGKGIDNYKLLSSYLRLLVESNPGTLTKLHTTVDESGLSKFKYLFIAFGASISGLPFLRKVVVIDGTQLKDKYRGTLVTASSQDGNMQIFPLAFGVVDSENDNSWIWFLEQLKEFVADEEDLVFVSDRHKSIAAGIARVFPNAHHAYCIVHLHRNVKHRFKIQGLADTVDRAARAYTRTDFDNHWREIEGRSMGCARYLREIGFKSWARIHCGGARYNLMSSNISESLNAALKKAVLYPIITMIEFIRTMLMRWFFTRRDKSSKWSSLCTPVIEKILVGNLKLSASMKATASNSWVYQVNDAKGRTNVVDLDNKSCSCLVFDALKIPCPHAISAANLRGTDVYTLVHPFYSTSYRQQLYAESIMPVIDIESATDPNDLDHLFPPNTRRPPGRPKRVRIPSQGEFTNRGPYKAPRCGRCLKPGHNRKTCKNAI